MEPLGEPDRADESHTLVSQAHQLPTPALSPVTERPSFELERNPDEDLNGHVGNGFASNGTGKKDVGGASASIAAGTDDAKDGFQVVKGKRRKSSVTKPNLPLSPRSERERVLKLSSAQIKELTSSPNSLPVRAASPIPEIALGPSPILHEKDTNRSESPGRQDVTRTPSPVKGDAQQSPNSGGASARPKASRHASDAKPPVDPFKAPRPGLSARAVSTPAMRRKTTSAKSHGHTHDGHGKPGKPIPPPLNIGDKVGTSQSGGLKFQGPSEMAASPVPSTIPMPPLSMATYLQLELAADKPSPLYIYRSANADFPYESAKVKYERLLNFLLLPPQLESTLIFGFFTCLDAFLYTFTILPLRFGKALWMLVEWWMRTILKEAKDLGNFVYWGVGRLWRRRGGSVSSSSSSAPRGDGDRSRRPSGTSPTVPSTSPASDFGEQLRKDASAQESTRKALRYTSYRHRRTKSSPSALTPDHKADILKGLLVITSCFVLMHFDASRMYHNIRGQAAIKLYVIYNVLEVFDRLFSALGQDVLECLFSQETLERNPNGRSKVLRPFFMFILALVYNVIHATALFYQVITLNVAVNSYSNALLTLLMSNQFVEIKGTVFKKFEKENLFQMTCADVVERFQLFLMLFIIAMRNIVEVGGLTLGSASFASSNRSSSNSTAAPLTSASVIPQSFTMFSWINGQVLGPFLIVLGSEMMVDWLKHAYITKFNSTKPDIYGRFLDVLAKDYYSNAFADQNLTKRLGLPVIPLACLFIRAMVQTYKMFIATHIPYPIPSSATALSTESATTSSPATTAALARIDQVFRRALGRSTFGGVGGSPDSSFNWWSLDDLIALVLMLLMWGAAWFALLAFKLVLGMVILSFSRRRYKRMKEREKMVFDTGGKRIGGWGMVEVQEDKKKWIYVDDPDSLKTLKEKEVRNKQREEKGIGDLSGVDRYTMVAKRIW